MEEAIQTTLFKEESKPKPVVQKQTLTPKSIIDHEHVESKEIPDQTHACITLEYCKEVDVKGQILHEGISAAESLEIKPYPQEQSCYGGFWGGGGFFGKDKLAQLYDYLLAFKKRMLERPYTDDLKNAFRFTNLKAENVFINVSDKTKEFIGKESGKSWDTFLSEWNNIKNFLPTEEYKALAQREYELGKRISEMKSPNGDAHKIESVIRQKLQLSGSFYGGKKTCIEYAGKSPVALVGLLEKARSEIIAMEQELKAIQEKLDQEKVKTIPMKCINQ